MPTPAGTPGRKPAKAALTKAPPPIDLREDLKEAVAKIEELEQEIEVLTELLEHTQEEKEADEDLLEGLRKTLQERMEVEESDKKVLWLIHTACELRFTVSTHHRKTGALNKSF